jgi:hypothetical protein
VKKKNLAIVIISLWLVVICLFMLLAARIDLEIFFVLWLIGFLVIIELTDTRFALPPYLRYTKYIVAAGIVIFGIIGMRKIMEILYS